MIRVLLNVEGEERDIRHFNYYYFKPHRINKTFYRKFLHKNFPFEREDKNNLSPYYDNEIPTVSRPLSILDKDLMSRARMYYGKEKEKYYKELTRLRYLHKLDFGIIDSEPADLDMMPRYSDIKRHSMGGTESVGGLFSFSLESTHDDDLFYEWFFRGECLKGEFCFYDKMEEIPDFKIEFEEAYATDLEETYAAEGSEPMTLRMRITPAIVRNRGIIHEKNWKTKKIPFDPMLFFPKKEKEKETPIYITDAYWIDDEGNQQHACVTNIPVTLYIETDPPVFDREIKLEFEDAENAE